MNSEILTHHVAGYFTLPEIAKQLEVPNPWIYTLIYTGTIQIAKGARTGLYLFPEEPATNEKFRELKEGKIQILRF